MAPPRFARAVLSGVFSRARVATGRRKCAVAWIQCRDSVAERVLLCAIGAYPWGCDRMRRSSSTCSSVGMPSRIGAPCRRYVLTRFWPCRQCHLSAAVGLRRGEGAVVCGSVALQDGLLNERAVGRQAVVAPRLPHIDSDYVAPVVLLLAVIWTMIGSQRIHGRALLLLAAHSIGARYWPGQALHFLAIDPVRRYDCTVDQRAKRKFALAFQRVVPAMGAAVHPPRSPDQTGI